MEIDVTAEQEEKILRDVFENFPQASTGMALQCRRFKYDTFYWEMDKVYELLTDTLRELVTINYDTQQKVEGGGKNGRL